MNRQADELPAAALAPKRPPLGLHPPVWYLGAVLVMFALEWGFPPPWLPVFALQIAGAVVLAAGILLLLAAAFLFFRHKTPILPFQEPSFLISDGPYRISRNPIYLAQGVTLAGLSLMLGGGFSLLLPPVYIAFLHFTFVLPEELSLAATFGHRYESYRSSVPRWL